MKNIILIGFSIIIFISCTVQPNIKISGVFNLDKKQEILKESISNKNDVILNLGDALIKEFPDQKLWLYAETHEKNNYLGQKIILKNFVLILEFDEKGILKSKRKLTVADMKDIKFDNETTKTLALNETYSKKFFSGIKKRLESKQKLEN